MGRQVEDIQNDVHKMFLKYRSLDRLVQDFKFKEIFISADEEDKKRAVKIIKSVDSFKFLLWMKRQKEKNEDIACLGVRELRKIASLYGVSHYNKICKGELVRKIKQKKEAVIAEKLP